jgi:hypothetical protein
MLKGRCYPEKGETTQKQKEESRPRITKTYPTVGRENGRGRETQL